MIISLPPNLTAALNRWHPQPECSRLVQQFELYGHPVVVIRLQLGDVHAEAFGRTKEIYRTPERIAP